MNAPEALAALADALAAEAAKAAEDALYASTTTGSAALSGRAEGLRRARIVALEFAQRLTRDAAELAEGKYGLYCPSKAAEGEPQNDKGYCALRFD